MTPEQREQFRDKWMDHHGGGIKNVEIEVENYMESGQQSQNEATDPTGKDK